MAENISGKWKEPVPVSLIDIVLVNIQKLYSKEIIAECIKQISLRCLTRPVCKIQQLTTPAKWGISRPPCVLGGYYPPTTEHMVWGSADPPMGGYGVILLYYRGRIAKSSPILSKDPRNFMKLLKWILGAKH